MDWFKMQTIWGASLDRLSDTEAGRFIKAVYAFVRYGEEYDGSGKEELLVWQAMETLRNDIEKFAHAEAEANDAMEAKRDKRRKAAQIRWQKQRDALASTSMQNDAFASDAMQTMQNAPNKKQNKNKNRSRSIDTAVAEEDSLNEIAQDHEEIFNAMSYAGFPMDNATMDKVVELYIQYGKDKVLSAIDACVENSVKKLVYLKGVLESREKELTEPKPVPKEEEVRWLN